MICKSLKAKFLGLVLGALTITAISVMAGVGSGYSLFGNATLVSPGHNSNRAVQLVSDGNANPAIFSGIDFGVSPSLTINNLTDMSTDYNFTASSCGVGSPRFGITLAGVSGTIFVYIGPPPNYTGCAAGWTNSGELLTAASLVNRSQLPGGTFYDPWATAQTRYTGKQVTDIFLVSDYGPTGAQTVLIDNTSINGTTVTYEPDNKDDCKNGGWQNFTLAPGPFTNQGQCVSHFASNGRSN